MLVDVAIEPDASVKFQLQPRRLQRCQAPLSEQNRTVQCSWPVVILQCLINYHGPLGHSQSDCATIGQHLSSVCTISCVKLEASALQLSEPATSDAIDSEDEVPPHPHWQVFVLELGWVYILESVLYTLDCQCSATLCPRFFLIESNSRREIDAFSLTSKSGTD